MKNTEITLDELKEKFWLIKDVEDPTTEQMETAVTAEPLVVKFLEDNNVATDDIRLLAINNYPWTIAYMDQSYKQEWLENAVDTQPNLIKILKSDKFNLTDEVYKKALSKIPALIKYISQPSTDLLKVVAIKEPKLIDQMSDVPKEVKALAGLSS